MILLRFLCGLMSIGLLFACAHAEDLIVSASEEVVLEGSYVYGRVVVEPGGTISIWGGYSPPSDLRGHVHIAAESITVATDGRIDVAGTQAWASGRVPPAPLELRGGSGGGYGGKGGGPNAQAQGGTFGTKDQPTIAIGSQGGPGPGGLVIAGGLAGGALILRATSVVIDGVIGSDGRKGWDWGGSGPYPESYCGGGGASGGGILVIAENLVIGPSAKISANGGDGGQGATSGDCYSGWPGGGGRIKIFYEKGSISPEAVMEVDPGNHPDEREQCKGESAEPGTIHIQQVPSIERLLNPGDLNEDGSTDEKDLLILMQQWRNTSDVDE